MIAPRWRNKSALNIATSMIGVANIALTAHINFFPIFFFNFIVHTIYINRVIPNASPSTDVFEYEKNIAVITKREGIQIEDMRSLILTDFGIIVFSFIFTFTKFICFKSSDFDSFLIALSDICIVSSINPI